MDAISELLNRVEILPASPALLPKLAKVLDNISEANIHEIVDVILFDSALTAKLLQISNSAYFSPPQPITNVGDAISQIGYDTIYLLAAAINGEGCLRTAPGTGLDAVLLWKHSVLTAFGAQNLAKAAGLNNHLAFTAGLLHDLGKVVFVRAHGRNYAAYLDPVKRGAQTLVEWEKATYGCDHAEVGAALLERWKLPASLAAAVKYHHQPAAAGGDAPLAACICLGNTLSRTLHQPAFRLDDSDSNTQQAMQAIQLTTQDLAEQWNRIHQNWEFVQNVCDLRK